MILKTNIATSLILHKLIAGFIYQMSGKDAKGKLTGTDPEKLKATGFSAEQYNGALKLFHSINTKLTQYKSKLN